MWEWGLLGTIMPIPAPIPIEFCGFFIAFSFISFERVFTLHVVILFFWGGGGYAQGPGRIALPS